MSDRPRGLGSLLASSTAREAALPAPGGTSRILDLPIEAVRPHPKQPRRRFDPDALASLADSIRSHGLLQPIVVRPKGEDFELIAGERRWRAAQQAGIQTIRAICRPADDPSALAISLVENLQREDLDPIEEASAYRTMAEDLGMTHQQIGERVGRERSTVSNAVRLLELPASIQAKLVGGELSPGHGRVLLSVSDPAERERLAGLVAKRGLSVRELERAVYRGGRSEAAGMRGSRPAHITELEQRIAERLGVRARILEGRRGGRLVLSFRSNAEFMRILEVLEIADADI
jgi:ParB family chromosome partitioning protein